MEPDDERVGAKAARRRFRSSEEKRLIVEETLSSAESVAVVARRHGVNANQVFQWRKLYQSGLLGGTAPVKLLPVSVEEPAPPCGAAPAGESKAAAIHIELPGVALVSLEGAVDPGLARAVLDALRR